MGQAQSLDIYLMGNISFVTRSGGCFEVSSLFSHWKPIGTKLHMHLQQLQAALCMLANLHIMAPHNASPGVSVARCKCLCLLV